MSTTLKYNLYYPSGSSSPNVPLAMQTQAESTEAALTTVENLTKWKARNVAPATGTSLYATGTDVVATRQGTFVNVSGRLKRTTATQNVGTIAVGYRPSRDVYAAGIVDGVATVFQITASTGVITTPFLAAGTAADIMVQITYVVPDLPAAT